MSTNQNLDGVYETLESLQKMRLELPPNAQQRIPDELLSALANALQGQVFEIVRMLQEVQHAFEKKLFQDRLRLQKRFAEEKRAFESRYQASVCNEIDADAVLRLAAALDTEKAEMAERQKEELRKFDSNLVLQLDQKVLDQQSTLEKAGVPGFHVTNNPQEQRVQMHLLTLISRLDRRR